MLVALRADASTRLGAGHVMRCAALGMALRRTGAKPVFLCTAALGDLRHWLAGQGFDSMVLDSRLSDAGTPWELDADVDARSTLRTLAGFRHRAEWVVVDHYGLGAQWQRQVRGDGIRVLAIDDLADRPHDADVLVNPSLQPATGDSYGTLLPVRARRFLGPRYALLRPEFRIPTARPARSPQRLLACMGGTDPGDILTRVVDAFQRLPEPRPALDIAVGEASPNVDALRRRCANAPDIALHVQTSQMAELMARADLLIGSAGGLSWERCSAGLPALIGWTAENQHANAIALARARTGIGVGAWDAMTPSALAELLARVLRHPRLLHRQSLRASRLVDGRGAERIAAHMLADRVTLRPATRDDAEPAWRWRNAESTRRYFHDAQPVPLSAHIDWWSASLRSRSRELLVAAIGMLDVGVARLDESDGAATVSIYLDPALVGLGIGPEVLRALQRHALVTRARPRLRAEILTSNVASKVGFERAGFVQIGSEWSWEPSP